MRSIAYMQCIFDEENCVRCQRVVNGVAEFEGLCEPCYHWWSTAQEKGETTADFVVRTRKERLAGQRLFKGSKRVIDIRCVCCSGPDTNWIACSRAVAGVLEFEGLYKTCNKYWPTAQEKGETAADFVTRMRKERLAGQRLFKGSKRVIGMRCVCSSGPDAKYIACIRAIADGVRIRRTLLHKSELEKGEPCFIPFGVCSRNCQRSRSTHPTSAAVVRKAWTVAKGQNVPAARFIEDREIMARRQRDQANVVARLGASAPKT